MEIRKGMGKGYISPEDFEADTPVQAADEAYEEAMQAAMSRALSRIGGS